MRLRRGQFLRRVLIPVLASLSLGLTGCDGEAYFGLPWFHFASPLPGGFEVADTAEFTLRTPRRSNLRSLQVSLDGQPLPAAAW